MSDTLDDIEPEERYRETAEKRREIIDEAAALGDKERKVFSWDEMENVRTAMKTKGKQYQKPFTKMGEKMRRLLLKILNFYAKNEKVPASFNQTQLTMLKKTKGGPADLNGI